MRVAILIDTLQVGGAQKLVTRFAAVVPKESIHPTVISFRANAAPVNLDLLHSAGIEVITLPSRSLLDVGRLRQLIRFLRAEKFDLIHAHLSYANILGCLAGFYTGIPVIATLHSTSYEFQANVIPCDTPGESHSSLFCTSDRGRRIYCRGRAPESPGFANCECDPKWCSGSTSDLITGPTRSSAHNCWRRTAPGNHICRSVC